MFSKIQSYIQGITQLVYPLQCYGCASDLVTKEERVCLACLLNLPETDFADNKDNVVEKIFYGRLPIEAAMSLYFFTKNSVLQHLLHQLKYKNNPDVGTYFGKTIGRRLKESNRFGTIDFISPIPLSKKRIAKRGYNQSLAIANGIAQVLNIPVLDSLTIRQKDNETQTHKTRQERWENMHNIFYLENKDLIAGKHVLLVDDVVTTGATLEACGEIILQANEAKLSIATIAVAMH
jgi:ComF family protein